MTHAQVLGRGTGRTKYEVIMNLDCYVGTCVGTSVVRSSKPHPSSLERPTSPSGKAENELSEVEVLMILVMLMTSCHHRLLRLPLQLT